MAGISEVPESPGSFTAYVVRHTTGETLGVQQFGNVFEAIRTLNEIPREWAFQSVSKCGGGNCKAGGCGKNGGCGKKSSEARGDEENAAESSSSCSTGNC